MNESYRIGNIINLGKILITLCILIIFCIYLARGNTNTTYLLPAVVWLSSAGMISYKFKYAEHILMLVDAMIMGVIILFGSISDNFFVIAAIVLVFLFLSKEQKAEGRWCRLLFVYSIVLELVSIILILTDIQVYSPIVSELTKGLVADILLIIVTIAITIMGDNGNKRRTIIVNCILAGLILCMAVGALISAKVINNKYYKIFDELLTNDSGVCKIESALDGGVVSVEGTAVQDGSNIILDINSADKYQTFSYSRNENGTYKFELINTGIMLDVAGGGAEWMTNVQMWTENMQSPQNWIRLDLDNGYISLISECNGLALDVLAAAGIGSNIQVYGYNGEASQQFRLIPAYDGIKMAIVEEFRQISVYEVYKYLILLVFITILAFPFERIHFMKRR